MNLSDRLVLVRLAGALPSSSEEKKALQHLLRAGSQEDPIESWVQKHRQELGGLSQDLFQVTRQGTGWKIILDAGKKYFGSITTWNPEYKVFEHSRDSARGIPWENASWDVTDPKDFLKHLDRLLKTALQSVGSTEVTVQKSGGGFKVYMGPKEIGEIWKGMDKKWHNSKGSVGGGSRFDTKEDALSDLLGGSAPSSRSPNPAFQ
jgi:hypothetical protein